MRRSQRTCVCNAGFYCSGTSCAPCRICNSSAQFISNCSATSAASCKCNSGYYGDGFICTPCSVCDTSAAVLKDCSSAGGRTCACNSGFYGSGYAGFCFACKQCIGNSTGGSACSSIWLTSDTITCTCNLGFYGDGYSSCQLCPTGKYTDGVRCIPCTVCSIYANTTGTPWQSLPTVWYVRHSEVLVQLRIYGNGTVRQLCKSCDSNATNTGSNCTLPEQVTDPKVCVYNAGFYGSGTSCSQCQTCHPDATLTGASCTKGALRDTVTCRCNVGFAGDGYKNCALCPADFYEQSRKCKPCRICDVNAFRSGSCLAGGSEDVVACTCNAGYYGYESSDGLPCIPCKTCNSFATTYASCPRGSVTDVTNCPCNAGFGGDGLNCASCSDGKYSDTGTCKPCEQKHIRHCQVFL